MSELRIHYGPSYRVYFQQRGAVLIVLLCGGDKKTQARDVAKAKKLLIGAEPQPSIPFALSVACASKRGRSAEWSMPFDFGAARPRLS